MLDPVCDFVNEKCSVNCFFGFDETLGCQIPGGSEVEQNGYDFALALFN
jgi:hypothetical protein